MTGESGRRWPAAPARARTHSPTSAPSAGRPRRQHPTQQRATSRLDRLASTTCRYRCRRCTTRPLPTHQSRHSRSATIRPCSASPTLGGIESRPAARARQIRRTPQCWTTPRGGRTDCRRCDPAAESRPWSIAPGSCPVRRARNTADLVDAEPFEIDSSHPRQSIQVGDRPDERRRPIRQRRAKRCDHHELAWDPATVQYAPATPSTVVKPSGRRR